MVKWTYKLIPMVEVTAHQNGEFSCPAKDLLVWSKYDLASARSAFSTFFPCYDTTAYLHNFTSESLEGRTIP